MTCNASQDYVIIYRMRKMTIVIREEAAHASIQQHSVRRQPR